MHPAGLLDLLMMFYYMSHAGGCNTGCTCLHCDHILLPQGILLTLPMMMPRLQALHESPSQLALTTSQGRLTAARAQW
jgi:hypothetical protein